MKPVSLLKAAFLPIIEPAVLFPLVMFWVFVCIGTSGSPLGVIVLILCLPPVFRYQMIIIEACARGKKPAAFNAEFFDWTGSMWTLFPLPIVIALLWFGATAQSSFGDAGVIAVLAFAGALLPASLVVLAITRSPLQSLNPIAIGRLLRATGESFWIASVYLFVLGWAAVQAEQLPNIAGNFVHLFVLFSFSAVTGTLIEPFGLVDDVSIPDSIEPDEQNIVADLEKSRAEILGHAYGFISRGNREGGFKTIFEWIEMDQDPAGAWAWFFEHMMRWERVDHALFFGQHYIRDLFKYGDYKPALKVILRCRLVNDQFRPFREDVPTAIEAAQSSGNIELAEVLKRL
jgi:hypothetical protein